MKSPLILLILSCLSLTALAQSPCEEAAQIIQLAEQDLVARNYERAINRLLDVKDICPQEGAKVNALIKKAFQQIEGEKAAAQRAQREADKQKRSAQQAQKTAQAAQQESLQEKQRADSSLSVANRVLDQMYFYEEKFGLTLKNIAQERETPKYRYGYIDRQGKEVIAFEYEEATPFSHMDGFARVQIDKQKYLLDTAGVIYRLAESLAELDAQTEALDLHENLPDSLPSEIGKYQALKVLLLYQGGGGEVRSKAYRPLLVN